jgi:hypothetical protein
VVRAARAAEHANLVRRRLAAQRDPRAVVALEKGALVAALARLADERASLAVGRVRIALEVIRHVVRVRILFARPLGALLARGRDVAAMTRDRLAFVTSTLGTAPKAHEAVHARCCVRTGDNNGNELVAESPGSPPTNSTY